jgi:hypothetical protein
MASKAQFFVSLNSKSVEDHIFLDLTCRTRDKLRISLFSSRFQGFPPEVHVVPNVGIVKLFLPIPGDQSIL